MKQECIPPFLGIVGDKKWSPFLDFGIRKPIFLHPKAAIFGDNHFTKFGDERNGKFGGDLVTISAQTVLKIFGTYLMTNLSQNKVTYLKRDTILMTQKIIQ